MIYLLFSLLFVKHFLADYLLQPDWMSNGKRLEGVEGLQFLTWHSVTHGFLAFCFLVTFGWQIALVIAIVDFVTHFSIDSGKVYFEKKNMFSDRTLTVFDQCLHALCYIIYVIIILSI